MNLNLSTTRGGEKTPFEPLETGVVHMYHCGPTVTESININKFRAYLLGDLLRRSFELHGLRVSQVMNITDVGHLNEFGEDALEIAAGRTGKLPEQLADEAIQAFHEDRKALRILDAHEYPRAHDNVEEMIELVRKLESAGVVYESGKNVYFDVHQAASYGGLTGQTVEELAKTAAPPEGDREMGLRRHPLDIALWRTDILHDMHWQSPWGLGFPGWHLECVAMSRRYLGTTFDIHTGSEENIFPHHECEIALAEASENKPLARYWLHSGHVLIDGNTVSRANKNFLTVDGLRSTDVQGVEIRAALLGTHYRQRLQFHYEVIEEVRGQIKRLNDAAAKLEGATSNAADEVQVRLDAAEKEFCDALDDDLDFPRALQAALQLADAVNDGSCPACAEAREKLERFDQVLALLG